MGEAQFASLFIEGAAATFAARAAAGAAASAAGMAAPEPMNAYLDNQDHEDWSMAQALRDIAFGGAMGGGAHVLGGKFTDWMDSRKAAAALAANPICQQICWRTWRRLDGSTSTLPATTCGAPTTRSAPTG